MQSLAYMENCPNFRNTRVVDVVADLPDYGEKVDVHDPWVDPTEALAEYGIARVSTPEPKAYDGVILAVAHGSYREARATALRGYGRAGHVFCNPKSVFGRDESDLRL